MGLEFKGVEAAIARIRKAEIDLQNKVAETKKRLVRHIITDLISNSPQWSGNLAQQWYVEYTGHSGSYHQKHSYVPPELWRGQPFVRGEEPYHMGDNPAVSYTLGRELPKVEGIRWNTKVTIANHAPYAEEVEAGIGPNGRPIRSENLGYAGGVAMVAYVTLKYKNLRYLRGLAE